MQTLIISYLAFRLRMSSQHLTHSAAISSAITYAISFPDSRALESE